MEALLIVNQIVFCEYMSIPKYKLFFSMKLINYLYGFVEIQIVMRPHSLTTF